MGAFGTVDEMPAAKRARTENGAPSLATTGSARVNLLSKLTRDAPQNPEFAAWMSASWAEDALDTLRLIFAGRDCRGGKGDRASFHAAMSWVQANHPAWWAASLPHVPFYGRYLDWVELHNAAPGGGEPAAALVALICAQLREDVAHLDDGQPVSLLAKWLPGERKKHDRAHLLRAVCKALFGAAAVTPYHYRLLRRDFLSPLRAHLALVERAMCAGGWESIDYSRVPSVAMNRLKQAFAMHSPERFSAWKAALAGGHAKVNSSQVDAHELVAEYVGGRLQAPDEVVEAQWRGVLEAAAKLGALEHTLVLSDVSGSMEGEPMMVSVALGILIASLTCEHFRGLLLTFEETPRLHAMPLGGSLFEQVQSVAGMPWGGSTDLHGAFRAILGRAEQLALPPAAMPRRLVVLSDMQFDQAFAQAGTQFQEIERMYAAAGYARPDIIFWNLRSNTTTDFPVTADQPGVALLSGFRPAVLKQVIAGSDMSPYSIMRGAIDDERYARIVPPTGGAAAE